MELASRSVGQRSKRKGRADRDSGGRFDASGRLAALQKACRDSTNDEKTCTRARFRFVPPDLYDASKGQAGTAVSESLDVPILPRLAPILILEKWTRGPSTQRGSRASSGAARRELEQVKLAWTTPGDASW